MGSFVYAVQMDGHELCGHQHARRSQATNCAINLSRRHRLTARFAVTRYTLDRGSPDPKTLEVFERAGRCIECGQSLILSHRHEFGHHSDCPMIGGGD